MKTEKMAKIEDFLRTLNVENLDIMDFVDVEEIDTENAYQSIYDMIEENGGFDIDIIYYSNAIKYLSENDNSLRESLNLACDMGFSLENLNSEILASLLASQEVRNDFAELENKIEDFFSELEEQQ